LNDTTLSSKINDNLQKVKCKLEIANLKLLVAEHTKKLNDLDAEFQKNTGLLQAESILKEVQDTSKNFIKYIESIEEPHLQEFTSQILPQLHEYQYKIDRNQLQFNMIVITK